MTQRTRDEIDYGVFLAYHLARAWGMPVTDTVAVLSQTGILRSYIIPCFDVLHSESTDAVVADITSFARERGAAV